MKFRGPEALNDTYKKQGRGGSPWGLRPLTFGLPSLRKLRPFPSPARSRSLHPCFVTSLLRYIITFLTWCGAAFPAPATLFHPWHANASANTFSLICTGAKRLRAPSAFRRTPPSHSRRTIHIVGSKLAQGTVK